MKIMKRFLLLSAMCLICFVCTGCIKVSYDMEITDDDKVSFTQTHGINLTPLKAVDPTVDEKLTNDIMTKTKELGSQGYTVKPFKDDKYTGVTLAKNDIDFLNASQYLPEAIKKTNKDAFTIKKGFLKNTYKIHITCSFEEIKNYMKNDNKTLEDKAQKGDISGSGNEEEEFVPSSPADYSYKSERRQQQELEESRQQEEEVKQSYSEIMSNAPGMTPVAEFTIKVPKKPVSHNATKVISDFEYQWNLVTNDGTPVDISIEYEKTNPKGVTISIILALFIGIIGLLRSKKRQ